MFLLSGNYTNMTSTITHIFKVRNWCAGQIVNINLYASSLTWWDSLPDSIKDDFHHNILDLTLYRFY